MTNEKTIDDYIELLNETVEEYSEDTSKRAVSGEEGVCSYSLDTGLPHEKCCAIGRLLTEDTKKTLVDANLNSLHLCFAEDSFKEEYRGFNDDFLVELQILHDNSIFWDKNGLTELGRERVENVRLKIQENYYQS